LKGGVNPALERLQEPDDREMFKDEKLKQIEAGKEKWEQETRPKFKDRPAKFVTVSSKPLNELYTPLDIQDLDYEQDLGFPGEYPYTRGVQGNMYRGRTWTMRQFSGFGTAKETNERYKYLLRHGQTGLSVAFDMPTIMGYDSDHPRALGEVGRCGVAIDSLADMEVLFDGIPLDQVTTSMTINGPASILWCMYHCHGGKTGGIPG